MSAHTPAGVTIPTNTTVSKTIEVVVLEATFQTVPYGAREAQTWFNVSDFLDLCAVPGFAGDAQTSWIPTPQCPALTAWYELRHEIDQGIGPKMHIESGERYSAWIWDSEKKVLDPVTYDSAYDK